MNEFIVWDKDSKEFIDESYPFYLAPTGLLCIRQNNGRMIYDNNMEYFYYIGKTDDTQEQNKIYADCSIVEFYSRLHGRQKGYFSYDSQSLRYDIKLFNGMKVYYNLLDETISNLKVIGTIQEDKQLLSK